MTLHTPQPGIMQIALYQGGKSKIAGRAEVLKLSSNENPLGVPPTAQRAIVAAAGQAPLGSGDEIPRPAMAAGLRRRHADQTPVHARRIPGRPPPGPRGELLVRRGELTATPVAGVVEHGLA